MVHEMPDNYEMIYRMVIDWTRALAPCPIGPRKW